MRLVQTGESVDEGLRARLAKAPLRRTLAFTNSGLTLGAGAVIAKMTTDARGRPAGLALAGEEDAILVRFAAAFGKAVLPHVIGNLSRASEHWARGDRCLAYIHLAHAGLPEIDEAGAWRLALCDEALALGCAPRAIYRALDLEPPLSFRKFNPDQPRTPAGSGRESGRWTSGAAGAAAAVREGRSVSPGDKHGDNEDDKLEDFKAKLGEETDEQAIEHGRPLNPMQMPFGTRCRCPSAARPLPDRLARPRSARPRRCRRNLSFWGPIRRTAAHAGTPICRVELTRRSLFFSG